MRWSFWAKAESKAAATEPDARSIVRRARRLRFRVHPDAVSALVGAYVGARVGSGLAFAELKPYEPGDEVRHIDWKVTARQGRPYVRRFVEERSLILRLVVDVSASLWFGREGQTKADRAAQAAALLAAAAIHGGDRVGLTLVGDRVEAAIPPAGGVRHLSRVLRLLVASPMTPRGTNLASAIPRGRRRERGLIVVLSDFLDPGPAAAWRRAGRPRDRIALRLVDPLEDRLPETGLLALEEAETGRRWTIDGRSARVRCAYALAARERRDAFQVWCREAGMRGVELSTVEDPLVGLLRLFRDRAARVGGPR